MNRPSAGVPAVVADGVVKRFSTPALVEAVRGVTAEVAAGEFVALVGPSGSGKSTLLSILGGLMAPTAGSVRLGGEALDGLAPRALARVRNRNVGFVFQFHHLLAELTALENVALPALIAAREGWRDRSAAAIEAAARDWLGAVGLAHRADHRPAQLSGGEGQRVALARALINEPAVVLADEPTGNLDQDTARDLVDLMLDLNRRDGRTFLIATHNQELVDRAGRVLRLVDGSLKAP